MFPSDDVTETKITTTDSASTTQTCPTKDRATSTKDAGRVHIGGGMMHFGSTKDAGRVRIGGGMMRF